jgi:cellulose biosynthesis protein BcsQ
MYDFSETAFDSLIDILRANTPCVILDIPHIWTAWARRMLVNADEIVIVAAPDLANLRNTKNMLDMLRSARAHHERPKLIMNCVGIPKRPEISVNDFRQGGRSRAFRNHSFPAKALWPRRQQWADDCRSRGGRETRGHDQGSCAKNYRPERTA